MSISWGSSEKKDRRAQSVVLPSASAEETELRKLNLEMAKRQLASLEAADKQAAADEADPLRIQQKEVERLATENLLARMKGTAPVLDPGQQALLDTTYGAAKARGQDSIRNFVDSRAGELGIRASDLLPLLAAEAGKLNTNLEGQRAASSLDLSQAGNNFNQMLMSFTNDLKQRAYMNRLQLAGLNPAPYAMQSNLFGERLAGAGRTMTGRSEGSQFGYGVSGSDAQGYGQGLFGTKGFFG